MSLSWAIYAFVSGACVALSLCHVQPMQLPVGQEAIPKTLVYNGSELASVRARSHKEDPELMSALKRLTDAAVTLLHKGENWTVMAKARTPPSGSKHDYESIGPYWWPCNNKTWEVDHKNGLVTAKCNDSTGLPWVRHDGVHNPITDEFDSKPNQLMSGAVQTLSAAYYFTQNKTFARKAVELLDQWYLSSSSCMHPNLNFGQMIPGVCDGRGIGIIDTSGWWGIIDSIALLAVDGGIDNETHESLQLWFHNYTEWLVNSKIGTDESNAKNNHGTWYDTQTQSFALFSGLTSIAEKIAYEAPAKRIDKEIKSDGEMPMEDARTKSESYCTFNLNAFFDLASLAHHSGENLWTYTGKDGQSIRKALDFMIPYATGKKKWPFKQIETFSWGSMFSLFRRASVVYNNATYEDIIAQLPDVHEDDITNLLFPRKFKTPGTSRKVSNPKASKNPPYVDFDGAMIPSLFWKLPL